MDRRCGGVKFRRRGEKGWECEREVGVWMGGNSEMRRVECREDRLREEKGVGEELLHGREAPLQRGERPLLARLSDRPRLA